MLVEDDESIIQILTATLTQQHYVVDVAIDGEAGWEMVEAYPYNLVVLDIMLPKLNGIRFCQRLRSRRSAVLVMLLTARDTPADKLAGLNSGADDYVVKPFNPQKLVARIRALLRRGSTAPSSVLTCGNLRLDPETRDATYNGQTLSLSRKEYLLLEVFLRSQHQVFSRTAIVDRFWSYGEDPPMEDTVKSHIKGLRRKLGAVGAENLVETRYEQGYRINPAYLAAIEEAVPITPPPSELSSPVQSVEAELVRIWEQTQELTLAQVAVLEQTVTGLRSATLDQAAWDCARQSAYKMAGSLGMFRVESGSLAQRKAVRLYRPPSKAWPLGSPSRRISRKEFLTTVHSDVTHENYFMENLQDAIKDVKEALPNITPTPPQLKSQAAPEDLKSRLEWGEPALTIVDARDREAFNKTHILGSMPMPIDELEERAKASLQIERDIYIYGSSDGETTQAASTLRQSGFQNVAELKGGLEGWKAIEGPIEGSEVILNPGPDAYNVVSRVSHHLETQKPDFEK